MDGSDFDLWKVVAQAAFDRKMSAGADSLTGVQKVALAVWAASGMIGNRGFFDHSQEEMAEWAAAYDALQISAAAEAIRHAARLIPMIDWSGQDPCEQELDALEQRYYTADEQTQAAMAALIRKFPDEAFAGL